MSMQQISFELFGCENLRFIKGTAENVMIALNSIKSLGIQIASSNHIETRSEHDIVTVTMKLVNGVAFCEINITMMYVLVTLVCDSKLDKKLVDEFVDYFKSNYDPSTVRAVKIPLNDKKANRKITNEIVHPVSNK